MLSTGPNTTMIRYIFLTVLIITLLSGCLATDDDSPEACAHAVTQDLDAGRWNAALERLDRASCRQALDESERQIDRAAAFIGRAGYELGDLVNAVLDKPADTEREELRLLESLGGLGVSPGGLRDLDLSLLAHGEAVADAGDGSSARLLEQACRRNQVPDLDEAQRDACFLGGLFSFARFARVLALLLEEDTAEWVEKSSLSCRSDRNNSGVPDSAEATACAIAAREQGARAGELCQAATAERGAVRWEPLPEGERIPFRIDNEEFARLRPVRIRVEPGMACPGESEKVRYRLISQHDDPTLAITDGLCRRNVREPCDEADPASDCWPCPVARGDGSEVLTISNSLLGPINREAELMLFVLPEVDQERVVERIEATRARLCKRAAGTPRACEQRDDGATRVRESALGAYFKR